jgi:DNA invertase Pin-like site-specific DNA recombinase
MLNQPAIYSYTRVSTTKQVTGTSLQSQVEQPVLDKLSKEYSLPISEEVFSDEGQSAYHGFNLKNELGRVLSLIDSGSITNGSIIVIFSLDRLSRQAVGVATEMLLSILNRGVRIYTTIDDKLLCSTNGNLMADLMMVLVTFERANNESSTKSTRVKAAGLKGIEAHQLGENRSTDNFAKAVKGVAGKHPFYIDITDGYVRPHEYYWPVAKLVVQRILEGVGLATVVKELNNKFKPLGSTKAFNKQTLYNLKDNIAITGTRQILMDGTTHTLSNYFPPLVTQDEYNLLRQVAKSRTTPVGSSGFVSIVTGLNLTKCYCGGPLCSKVTSGTQRLICTNAVDRNTCKGMSLKSEWVEQAVVDTCIDVLVKSNIPVKSNSEKDALQIQLSSKQADLVKLSDKALESDLPKILLNKMVQLEADIESLQRDINALIEVSAEDIGSLAQQWKPIKTLPSIDDSKARLAIKLLVKKSINNITVEKLSTTSQYKFTFTLVNGHTRSVVCTRGKYSTPEVSDMPDTYIGPYELDGELEEISKAYEAKVMKSINKGGLLK